MLAELAGDQAAVDQPAKAQGGVEALADEIDVALGVVHLDLQAGVAAGEVREHRRQPLPPHGRGEGQAQASPQLDAAGGGFLLGFRDHIRRTLQPFSQPRPRFRQPHPPRGPLDQAHAQPSLQRADAPGQDSRMAAEGGSRRGERAVPGYGEEGGVFVRLAAIVAHGSRHRGA